MLCKAKPESTEKAATVPGDACDSTLANGRYGDQSALRSRIQRGLAVLGGETVLADGPFEISHCRTETHHKPHDERQLSGVSNPASEA